MLKNLKPIQKKFVAIYTNPKHPAYSNRIQAGMEAGYSEEYSKVILNRDNELSRVVKSMNDNLIETAKKNVEVVLNYDDKLDARVIQTSQFVLKNLDKDFKDNSVSTQTNNIIVLDESKQALLLSRLGL